MLNEKFWSEGSIRKQISEFIEKDSLLSQIGKERRSLLTDSLIALTIKLKETIFREVEKEYQREDVITQVEEIYGERGTQIIECIPLQKIDDIVTSWQDKLENIESRMEPYWDTLRDTLEEETFLTEEFDEYEEREFQLYLVYLKDWTTSHSEGSPVSIDEFLDNEMNDPATAKYYKNLLAEFKKLKKEIKQ